MVVILLFLGIIFRCGFAQNVLADTVIDVYPASNGGFSLLGVESSFGGSFVGSSYVITKPTDPLEWGCDAAAYPPVNPLFKSAAIVARGNCTFATKVIAAQSVGYEAVVIHDAVSSMYFLANASQRTAPDLGTMALFGCDYHCPYGSATIDASTVTLQDAYDGLPGRCNPSGSCGSNLCGFTAPATPGSSQRQVCCIVSDLMSPGAVEAQANVTSIPSIFLSASDGRRLLTSVTSGSTTVSIAARPIPSFQAGTFVIWILGCATVIFASYLAYVFDKEEKRPLQHRTNSTSGSSNRNTSRNTHRPVLPTTPPVSLTVWQAVGLLLLSCIVLLTLFLLIRNGINIVYIVIVVFAIASVSAVTQLIMYPLLARVAPKLDDIVVFERSNRWVEARLTLALVVAFVLSVGPMLAWVLTRHQSYSWVLNNILSVIVSCLAVAQLRIARLRDIAIIFVLFFIYDIFMVFLSPYVFGTSVMIEVATAGQPSGPPVAQVDAACYCRQHPSDADACGPGEIMPILLRLPRFGDYRGGYAMLGMGDLILPGFLLAFTARFQRDPKAPASLFSNVYWWTACIGYMAGLGLANLAVVLTKAGQPALLYLCPATLIPVAILAYFYGDLRAMWFGAQAAATAAAGNEPETAISSEPMMDRAAVSVDEDATGVLQTDSQSPPSGERTPLRSECVDVLVDAATSQQQQDAHEGQQAAPKE